MQAEGIEVTVRRAIKQALKSYKICKHRARSSFHRVLSAYLSRAIDFRYTSSS